MQVYSQCVVLILYWRQRVCFIFISFITSYDKQFRGLHKSNYTIGFLTGQKNGMLHTASNYWETQKIYLKKI